MNENLPTNVQMNANDNGTVIFATDVISTIAGLAATEVEGVTNMVGASSGGFSEIFSRKNQSSKSLTKGVKVEVGTEEVAVDLYVAVDYGTPIKRAAADAQENVRKAIESMTGLHVVRVDVHVQSVSFEQEKKALQAGAQNAALAAGNTENTAEEPAAEPAAGPKETVKPEEKPKAEKPREEKQETSDKEAPVEKAAEAKSVRKPARKPSGSKKPKTEPAETKDGQA